MKNLVYILWFISFIFFLNVVLYFWNDNYKLFLKKIKNPWKSIYIDNINVSDDTQNDFKELIKTNDVIIEDSDKTDLDLSDISDKTDLLVDDELDEEIKSDIEDIEKVLSEDLNLWEDDIKENEIKTDLDFELDETDKYIIDLFKENYPLDLVKYYVSLFWLTNEYPDKYLEFKSKDLNLYIFWNKKKYSEVLDIFEVLTFELPFKINKVDNFWGRSFYINLNEKDNFIRLVFSYKTNIYWIKVEEKQYDYVKLLLKQL